MGAGAMTGRRRARAPGEAIDVVGLGASAGGLEALEQFFAGAPIDAGLAYVIVSHLDPDHVTLLPELLQRTTAMPVREIVDGVVLAADAVYVIPPGRTLALVGDRLKLRAIPRRRGPSALVDGFFASLAAARGARAIGVVLSGMGTDGAAGVAAIAAAGGAVLVQDPAASAFPGMPQAALAAVPAAVRAAAGDLPPAVVAAAHARRAPNAADAPDRAALAQIVVTLRERTGHDLGQYKPGALERRLARRIAVHHLPDLAAYAAYLEATPEEAALVFRELLIGVTQFFRDEAVFTVLRDQALPAILAAKARPRAVRAWVAGCSTGEEAYSLAIVIHEAIAASGLADVGVQIYATDIDAGAITVARAGRYPAAIRDQVAPARLARYFTPDDDGFRIAKVIRDTVVFAQHDLISDPPFTHLDVVCCRNVLIYLQPTLQQRLLPRFHHALDPGGVLVLGLSESTAAAASLFAALDPTTKVFRRVEGVRAPAERGGPAPWSRGVAAAAVTVSELSTVDAARRVIVDTVAPPAVLINQRGDVLYTSRRTGRYLEPAVGKTNINLFAMARDGLGLHLSMAVRQAIARRRRVVVRGVRLGGARSRAQLDLAVLPLTEPAALRGLLLVVFDEQPLVAVARAGRRPAAGRAASDGRELTRLKAQLQAVVREMEASQAQVEATNEQLQSANEELQSTNEEVTTSKEELMSLNEELLTLNAELEVRNHELATANADLRNVLDSTKIPTLFLDRDLRIKRFTPEVRRIVRLVDADVGRAIGDFTLTLDYPALAADVAAVLASLTPRQAQAAGPDGTTFTVRIDPYRTMDERVDGVVITFSDVTALRQAEAALAARAHDGVVARLLDRWPGMVWVRDLAGADVYLNDRARAHLRTCDPTPAARFAALIDPAQAPDGPTWLRRLAAAPDGEVVTRKLRLRDAAGGYVTYRDRESVLGRGPTGAPTRVLAVIEAVRP